MKCKCGETIENNKTINIFKDHVLIVTTCDCGRRIHQSFDLVETTFFYDGKMEKSCKNKR